MSDPREKAPVHHVLRLLAERLEAFLEGDDLAFESLPDALDGAEFDADDLHAAAVVLRHLASDTTSGESALDGTPPAAALRVLSAEERTSLSPEAWGALLALRRGGSLNPAQFERVLGLLGGSGVRPVNADLAVEVASRVALEDGEDATETAHGEIDQAH
jgi:hypothetical protein